MLVETCWYTDKADEEIDCAVVAGLHCINQAKSEGTSGHFRRSNFWYGNWLIWMLIHWGDCLSTSAISGWLILSLHYICLFSLFSCDCSYSRRKFFSHYSILAVAHVELMFCILALLINICSKSGFLSVVDWYWYYPWKHLIALCGLIISNASV